MIPHTHENVNMTEYTDTRIPKLFLWLIERTDTLRGSFTFTTHEIIPHATTNTETRTIARRKYRRLPSTFSSQMEYTDTVIRFSAAFYESFRQDIIPNVTYNSLVTHTRARHSDWRIHGIFSMIISDINILKHSFASNSLYHPTRCY